MSEEITYYCYVLIPMRVLMSVKAKDSLEATSLLASEPSVCGIVGVPSPIPPDGTHVKPW